MPLKSYVVQTLEETAGKRKFNNGFSLDYLFESDFVPAQVPTLVRLGTFDETVEAKKVFRGGSGWLVFRGHKSVEEKRGPDLVRILSKRMKINMNDAKAVVNDMFEELDLIAEERDVEPLSIDEKEQLVLAITKTAGNLVKEALKKK